MGINSGNVAAGNMGSDKRFQYTVMGDAVNQAARLEPVNTDYGSEIIVGDTTYHMVKSQLITRMLGKILMVGKTEIVPIHELIGMRGEVPQNEIDIIDNYEKALDLIREGAMTYKTERLDDGKRN